MNLIDEVAAAVEVAFKRLWPFQGESEIVRDVEAAEERRQAEERSRLFQAEREKARPHVSQLGFMVDNVFQAAAFEAHLDGLAHKALAAGADLAAAEEVTRKALARKEAVRLTTSDVAVALQRLSPETYPREDPETPSKMHEFCARFARAYSKEGKVRSAAAIVEYLLASDYDHAFWLVSEWIAACVALGDHTSAEAFGAALTSGESACAHHFATRGGSARPRLMVAKALIALQRDGDVDQAHEIAKAAKQTFGDSREAIGAFRAISYVKQEVDAGRLTLEYKPDGHGGYAVLGLERLVSPRGLLTGKFNEETPS